MKPERNNNQEKFNWNSSNDSFSTEFIVGKEGRIYLNAKINGKAGLLLFDTGAGITSVNEKLVSDPDMKLSSNIITDAKGLTQTKNLYKTKSFELAAINIEGLKVYPQDSLSWTDPKGVHYKKDSVIGIIGNNIISNYIWNFDLKNKRVTVSNDKKYCHNLPDSLAIKLIPKNNYKEIQVLINGEPKMLTLDFGCSQPLVLSDSIPSQNKFKFKGSSISQNSRTFLNHITKSKTPYTPISFVDVSFGPNQFNRVRGTENAVSNLFGIPFIWAYERVVVDYKNDKIYFLSASDSVSTFGVKINSRKSLEAILGIILKTENGKAELALRNELKLPIKWINNQNDTSRSEYKLYGNISIYGGKKDPNAGYYVIDSIAAVDSLMLPNGIIQHGPYMVDYTKKYYVE